MSTTVKLLTKPDTFRFSCLTINPLPSARILRAYYEADYVLLRDDKPENEWSLDMPLDFAERLFTALKHIKAGKPMNCHRFSRILTGTEEPRFALDSESYAVSDIHNKNRSTALHLGELGLVGSETEVNGARHSLIGLGKDSPYSLQVLSAQSDIGIARYDDVLNLYRGSWPNERSADLYRAELL